MSNNKKLCKLYDEDEPNLMLLSEDQIAMIGWLAGRGYDFKIELVSNELKEVTFEDWKDKAIRRY